MRVLECWRVGDFLMLVVGCAVPPIPPAPFPPAQGGKGGVQAESEASGFEWYLLVVDGGGLLSAFPLEDDGATSGSSEEVSG